MKPYIKIVLTLASVIVIMITANIYFKDHPTINSTNKKIDYLLPVKPELPIITDKCVSKNDPIKTNPTFNDISGAGCGKTNSYVDKQIKWRAIVSDYAHTSGIRFLVIDKEHVIDELQQHGHFWGTFLASAENDPRATESGLKQWEEKWDSSWINYLMDTFGGINYKDDIGSKFFLVTAIINYVDCGSEIDGCYIETTVKKIEADK